MAHLWVAGPPPREADDTATALQEAGVDGFVYAGCDALAALRTTHAVTLGVEWAEVVA